MTFEIEVGGRTRTVSVEAVTTVGLDGVCSVSASMASRTKWTRGRQSWASPGPWDSGRSADVAITYRAAGELLLQLPKANVTALVDARRFRRGGGGPAAVAGEHRVLAPMPGRVLRVLVKAGDTVTARQGLVVVEAMKMENEITSPKDGRVKEVGVSDGQSVEVGRLLVVVE